jgi:hypothetical protein
MDRADFDLTHEIIRKIKSRFHAARIPENWFSVNGPGYAHFAIRERGESGLTIGIVACVVSARRGSSRSSRLRCDYLLHQRLETRIAAERLNEWVNFKRAEVCTVPILKAALEPSHCFVFVTKTEI